MNYDASLADSFRQVGYTPSRFVGERDQRIALQRSSFNFIRDAAPVASIATIPLIMEVNHSFRQRRSLSSSPTPRPIPARLIWRQAALAARSMLRANCLR
ncbi:MAG: hypothetical protein WBE48_27445 [Xanthobacteraceae bacterium]